MHTQSYGYNSVRNKSISKWNLIVNKIKTDMITESYIKVKKMIKTFFINSCQNQKIARKCFLFVMPKTISLTLKAPIP